MTMQQIELSNIQISQANPRKLFDDQKIDELAASIEQDGLIQNLVVHPAEGKDGKFFVIAGERRLRALRKLADEGKIEQDFTVPVELRDNLSKEEVLRLATVENVLREDLTPLEEAAAFAKLVKMGDSLEEIAAQTGLTKRTIKQRVALNGLCKEAKDAVADKEITLAQAEALTLGTTKMQKEALEHIGRYDSADDIRETLIGGKPTVAMAQFPLEQYKGRILRDLFADDETSYFDDEDQFFELQQKAVQDLADHYYRQTLAKWVDVTENYRLNDWQYEEAEDGQPYGVLINISPRGEVEIKEGLVKPEKIDEDTKEETAPAPQKKARPPYSKPIYQYIGWHKSLAVQEVLLSNPRKVKELSVLNALYNLEPHKGLDKISELPDQQSAFAAIDKQASHICKIMGVEVQAEEYAFEAVCSEAHGYKEDIFQSLQTLSDQELDEILAFATIIKFGQVSCDEPDTRENSLFNLVATDIQVEMRDHWTPDITFLNGRTQSQLVDIAGESGYFGYVGGYKKAELVNCLLKHFDASLKADKPDDRQQKANNWIPSVMEFPASLPETKQETGV